MYKLQKRQDGSILVSILAMTIFLVVLVSGLVVLANANLTRARNRILLLQAQYAAESGADAAIASLNNGVAFTGTTSAIQVLSNAQYRATYTTTVANGSNSSERIITAVGNVYVPASASTPRFVRSIEVIAQRSSTSGSTSMLSRNILYIASSVKDIQANDLYINGFIHLDKNSNKLIAEDITVADKNTGATNCSIGGPGSLAKPTSFTTPGQTKTNLTLAYNNCITPPGNTTNSNFNVLANQTTINKISSTYIPYSQFMDNTYQASPGGCNDWTTGASPRDIPSTGNTKKTHYPDTSAGVSSSCGTSGSLALGSNRYNIRDHIHVRASLCATSACSPTFYNPDSGASGIKFVFIEGTVNFDRVITASGSGPIVFVVYGSDPVSKASDCPYGGAFYLGNGETNAPQLFIVSSNGICLDKTKFSADPALGGFSGKNLYIATNSGTPHDLHLDVNFPASSIPVDLAWRAVRYRRL